MCAPSSPSPWSAHGSSCARERSGARVRRAILDKNVHIAAHSTVGFDPESDRARGYHVDESGITVVAKAAETPESRARYW